VALLRTLCDSEGLSVVLITHDTSIAETAQRVVRMRDGRILEPALEEVVPATGLRSIS
jgi:ABC-type lipoprotein export system ATPase subunit